MVLQPKINMVSEAEVTSYTGWCSPTQERSAFRRLGCAGLQTRSACNSDATFTANHPQQQDKELLQKSTETEETNEDSGVFDSTPPYTSVHDRYTTATSSCDRIANVSVQFPCSPSAEELARRLRAVQRNNRLTALTNAISVTHISHCWTAAVGRRHSTICQTAWSFVC